MKDSGIEWIGEIPDDWQTGKIKNVLSSYCSGATPDSSKEEYYDDNGTPWVVIADMSESDFIFDTAKHITEKAISDKHLTIIHAGAILYAMYASVGKVSELMIDATVNQAILALQFDLDKAGSQFMKFFLQACEPYVRAESNGTTQFNLNAGKVVNLSIAYPSLPKQKSIERYLDKKCAEIDRLIAHEETMIDELKAYKQSVITEAVTKGLDRTAPMKNSGVEWIGEIPEHWLIMPLKSKFNFGKGLSITKADLVSEGIKVISYGQIHAKYNKSHCINKSLYRFVDSQYLQICPSALVRRGDFIFADTSEDVEGSGDFVYIDNSDLIFAGYHCITLKNKNLHDGKYLAFLFMSQNWKNQIQSQVNGVKLFSITKRYLADAKLLLPPQNEQQQIADYLDKKCAEIDQLISLKQEKIEGLRDYKKSLIYEYVTGKKEVV